MSLIKKDQYLSAIKSGHFSYRRKPDIIKYFTLDKALQLASPSKLTKEIAFCLCTYPSERLYNERYMIAFNSIAIKCWDEVAVIQLSNEIKSFSDIICVNYKLVNNNKFKKENQLFFDLLLHEIKLLGKSI